MFFIYSITDINSSSPKSDRHQISPCDINALQNTLVMRIKDMMKQDESNNDTSTNSPHYFLGNI